MTREITFGDLDAELLLGGDVFVVPERDDRRAADENRGYLHPCASYPLSDLELETPGEA